MWSPPRRPDQEDKSYRSEYEKLPRRILRAASDERHKQYERKSEGGNSGKENKQIKTSKEGTITRKEREVKNKMPYESYIIKRARDARRMGRNGN